MLLVEELVACSPGRATVLGILRPDCPFLLPDGTLDPLACVELLAQAAAVMNGVESREAGEHLRSGLLVGARDFLFGPRATVGSALRVVVEKGASHDPLTIASGHVYAGGVQAAAGELHVFLGPPWTPPAPDPPGASSGASESIHPLLPCWGRRTSATTVSFVVSAAFPAFRGHFPRAPVLPAVASAMLAVEALQGNGNRRRLLGLPYARFRRPVLPDTTLEAACRPLDAGRWSATVKAGETLVADLVLAMEE